MKVEYQIDVEYANGKEGKHLTYRFESVELRNEIYKEIVSTFSQNIVEQSYLTMHGGVIISTYNYKEPSRGEIAQFVSHKYFEYQVLEKILKILEANSN